MLKENVQIGLSWLPLISKIVWAKNPRVKQIQEGFRLGKTRIWSFVNSPGQGAGEPNSLISVNICSVEGNSAGIFVIKLGVTLNFRN